MSEPPPGMQSKKSLLRRFKGLLSSSRSPSYQGAQSATTHNAGASISASSAPRVNTQGSLSPSHHPVTPHNAGASISASSAPQVNSQGTEYTAILDLPTTPSGPMTWEDWMKDWGSTTYEGLKTALQGIYNCSGILPPLQATAGVLLTISKVVDVRESMCSLCVNTILTFHLPIREFQ